MPNWLQKAMLATAAMNVSGFFVLAPPVHVFRELLGLPEPGHPLYLWLVAIWVLGFGVSYLYLGLTGREERLFVFIAAVGKLSFAALVFIEAAMGDLPMRAPLAGLGDLLFGSMFAYWLLQGRVAAPAPAPGR